MLRLADDPVLYDRLAAAGPAGASRFGWARFVESLDDALEQEMRKAAAPVHPVLAEAQG
jgi:hypothetical protein